MLPSRLGALADRFGRKPLMVLGMVAAAAGSFFFPSLPTVVSFAALCALLLALFLRLPTASPPDAELSVTPAI